MLPFVGQQSYCEYGGFIYLQFASSKQYNQQNELATGDPQWVVSSRQKGGIDLLGQWSIQNTLVLMLELWFR